MTRQEAELALRLATELQEAAKFVPMRVEDLLAIIEPSATTLEKLAPPMAVARLEQLEQLSVKDSVQRVLADLVPSAEEREHIRACRSALSKFFAELSCRSREVRKEQRDQFIREMRTILAQWPESRFRVGLLGTRIERGFRSALGDGGWLVPVMSDALHGPDLSAEMQREGFRLDSVSPLSAWFQCPSACVDCWGRLRHHMRSAIEAWVIPSVVNDRASGPPVRNKDAATMLGITPSQLSRWIGGDVTPNWAKKDLPRFRALLERPGRLLILSRIEALLAWKQEATSQRPSR